MYRPKLIALLGLPLLFAAFLLVGSLLLSPTAMRAQSPVGITDTPTPTLTAIPTATPGPQPLPVVPEASTLVLWGSAASALIGYAGLQLRARRRRR